MENFTTRIYIYHRWQRMREVGITPARLVEFHTGHKLLIRARDESRYRRRGRVVAEAGKQNIEKLSDEYLEPLMKAMKRPASRKQHGNVPWHLAGYLKRRIVSGDKAELVRLAEHYRPGQVPLEVRITKLEHHFRRCLDLYLGHRFYLQPLPEQLQLRNFI